MANSKKREKVLTPKQKRFADKYLECLNATEAYFYAYECERSTANAHGFRLLREPQVAKYIKKRMEALENDGVAQKLEILRYWTETMNDTTAKRSDRNRASEMLAKAHLMFMDEGEGDSKVEVNIDLSAIFDEGDNQQ